MRTQNLLVASVSFLMCLIAVYFGASIHNANANFQIDYLNEMDNLHYYDVSIVPKLTKLATIITLPFILTILLLELYIVKKSTARQVKNIARGLSIGWLILLGINILVMLNPLDYEFGKWGYCWMTIGILTVGGNIISAFIIGNKKI